MWSQEHQEDLTESEWQWSLSILSCLSRLISPSMHWETLKKTAEKATSERKKKQEQQQQTILRQTMKETRRILHLKEEKDNLSRCIRLDLNENQISCLSWWWCRQSLFLMLLWMWISCLPLLLLPFCPFLFFVIVRMLLPNIKETNNNGRRWTWGEKVEQKDVKFERVQIYIDLMEKRDSCETERNALWSSSLWFCI